MEIELEKRKNDDGNENDWLTRYTDFWNEIFLSLEFLDLIHSSKTCVLFRTMILDTSFLKKWITRMNLQNGINVDDQNVESMIKNIANYHFMLKNTPYHLIPLNLFEMKKNEIESKQQLKLYQLCFHEKEPFILTLLQFENSEKAIISLFKREELLYRFEQDSYTYDNDSFHLLSKIKGYLFCVVREDNFYRIIAVSITNPKDLLHFDIPFRSKKITWRISDHLIYFSQSSALLEYWFITIDDFVKFDQKSLSKEPTISLKCPKLVTTTSWFEYDHFFLENPKENPMFFRCDQGNIEKEVYLVYWIQWNEKKKILQVKQARFPEIKYLRYQKHELLFSKENLVVIFEKEIHHIQKALLDDVSFLDLTLDTFVKNEYNFNNVGNGYYGLDDLWIFFDNNDNPVCFSKQKNFKTILKGDTKKENRASEFCLKGNIVYYEAVRLNWHRKLSFLNPSKFKSEDSINLVDDEKTHDQKNKVLFANHTICFMKNEQNELFYVNFIPKKKDNNNNNVKEEED